MLCVLLFQVKTSFYVSLEETASQKSKKDEDDVGFDNVCDSQ